MLLSQSRPSSDYVIILYKESTPPELLLQEAPSWRGETKVLLQAQTTSLLARARALQATSIAMTHLPSCPICLTSRPDRSRSKPTPTEAGRANAKVDGAPKLVPKKTKSSG